MRKINNFLINILCGVTRLGHNSQIQKNQTETIRNKVRFDFDKLKLTKQINM